MGKHFIQFILVKRRTKRGISGLRQAGWGRPGGACQPHSGCSHTAVHTVTPAFSLPQPIW